MAKQILILCKSPREANQYAKLVGLQRFTYRYVARAGTIHGGLRNADVHVLPSFLDRIDRHRILSALRWTKCEVFYCDPADFEEPREQEAAEARAELEANVQAALNANPDDFSANLADAFIVADRKSTGTINDDGTVTFKVVAPDEADEAVELDPIDDPKINPDGRKRRYTCKVCDQKVFSDADPAHDQEAHATTEALKTQAPESASGFFG